MAHSTEQHESPVPELHNRWHTFSTALSRYGIVVAFVLLCGWYVWSHWDEFAFLSEISYCGATAAALFILASYVLSVLQMHLFLAKFGLKLGPVELTAITNGMILGNLVVPMRGGSGALAVYLKKAHGLNFSAFAAIYAGTALLVALVNTALALIALGLLWTLYEKFYPVLSVGVGLLFGICLYLSVFPPPVTWGSEGLIGLISRPAHSWHLLTRDRRLLAHVSFLILLTSLCLTGAFFFIYAAIGATLSLSGVIVTSSLGGIANLLGITPGALGIFDAVTIQIPQIFGLDPARAIVGTLVFRVLTFLWACILGLPGMTYMTLRRNAPTE